MASESGVINVAALEAAMNNEDFETNYGYTDAMVEASFITPAERLVSNHIGATVSSSSNNGIIFSVTEWARYFAHRAMVADDYLTVEKATKIDDVIKLTGINPKGILEPDVQSTSDTRSIFFKKRTS